MRIRDACHEEAEEEAEENELEDVSLRHGAEEILGDDVYEQALESLEWRVSKFLNRERQSIGSRLQPQLRTNTRSDQIDKKEASEHRQEARRQVVGEGFGADATDASSRAYPGDPADDRCRDERYDDHLQGTQEKISHELNAKDRLTYEPPGGCAGEQSYQNLPMERKSRHLDAELVRYE